MPSEIAVVSGASKGIGRQVALKLAQTGLSVLAIGRNEDDLRNLQKEVTDADYDLFYQIADMTDNNQFTRLVNMINNMPEKIKVLIQSAGIAHVGPVENLAFSKWQEMIDINLSIPFRLTQACLPHLAKNAHLFFLNSVAGRQTFNEWSGYCASKWGLRAFTDCLRHEITSKGIKVTSVYPASVDTQMHDRLPYDWDRSKMLQPQDVAEAIVSCYRQPAHVQTKEIHLENLAGTF